MEDFKQLVIFISEKTGKKQSEILEMIRKKQIEYNNLISDYGAAYLVAKDFGINIERDKEKSIKIKDLFPGISGIRLKAKILQINEPVSFERDDGSKGKVMNVMIGDETGIIRLVLWDEQVDEFEFKEGDIIEIINGYTKERKDGNVEIRLGMYGILKKSDGDIKVPEEFLIKGRSYEKKKIVEITKENENVELSAYITKFFYKNPLIYYCRECNETKDTKTCPEHGKIDPLLVISGIISDETSSIIFNMFDTTIQEFLGLSKEEIIKIIEEKGQDYFYEVLHHAINIKYRIFGNIKRNKYNDTLEITINRIKEIDPKNEVGVLLKEIEGTMIKEDQYTEGVQHD